MFYENFDFEALYFLEMSPMFLGSVQNFGSSDGDITLWKNAYFHKMHIYSVSPTRTKNHRWYLPILKPFFLSFIRYGFKVGQYPWYFTLGCLVFSALCGVGLINYTEEKNAFRFNFSIKWTGSLDSDLSPESDREYRVRLRQESLLFELLAKLNKLSKLTKLYFPYM